HLGGDAFCTVHLASGEVLAFNGSGAAGSGATLEYFNSIGGFPRTGLPLATVPGEVNLWTELHGRYGRKPLRELLAPAIEYARNGVPLTSILKKPLLTDDFRHSPYPETAAELLPNNGKAPEVGSILKQPRLARGLERIAGGGAEEFYRGAWAREMVATS